MYDKLDFMIFVIINIGYYFYFFLLVNYKVTYFKKIIIDKDMLFFFNKKF